MLEFFKSTNIKKVTPKEYLENNNSTAIFCNLETSNYVSNKSGKDLNLQHFIEISYIIIKGTPTYISSYNGVEISFITTNFEL